MDPQDKVEDTDKAEKTPGEAGQGNPPPKDSTEGLSDREIQDSVKDELAEDEAPKQAAWLDKLREAGIEHSFDDEDAAIQSYVELRKKLSERDQYAQFGQQVAGHYDAFQDYLKQQERQPKHDEPAPPWSPPHSYHPSWLAELQKPEEAQNQAIMRKLQEYGQYVHEKWQGWMFQPEMFVQEMVMPKIQQMISGSAEAQQRETRLSSVLDANREIASKYQAEIADMVKTHGVPLEYALAMVKMHDELQTMKSGKAVKEKVDEKRDMRTERASPASIPSKRKAVEATGVVAQNPHAAEKGSEEDESRWADPREAAREAMAQFGMTVD
jgi:hypothetical protein